MKLMQLQLLAADFILAHDSIMLSMLYAITSPSIFWSYSTSNWSAKSKSL